MLESHTTRVTTARCCPSWCMNHAKPFRFLIRSSSARRRRSESGVRALLGVPLLLSRRAATPWRVGVRAGEEGALPLAAAMRRRAMVDGLMGLEVGSGGGCGMGTPCSHVAALLESCSMVVCRRKEG